MQLPEKQLPVVYIEEPELAFGHGQNSDHPKDGLFLYGPHAGPATLIETLVFPGRPTFLRVDSAWGRSIIAHLVEI
jgi:hypothetical protein